jgi:hypothetical protein
MKIRMQSGAGNSCLVLIAAAAMFLTACEQKRDPQEGSTVASGDEFVVLIHNARIHTFDAGNTVLESGAMAFSGAGEILGIGDNGPMLQAFSGADRIDMDGRTVLPGLIDSHGHLYGLALSFTRANLVGTRGKADVLNRLKEFEENLHAGEWLLGRGWDQNDWPEQIFPSRADLDAEFPGRPVWLERIDGHAGWGNSLAIAQADADLGRSSSRLYPGHPLSWPKRRWIWRRKPWSVWVSRECMIRESTARSSVYTKRKLRRNPFPCASMRWPMA